MSAPNIVTTNNPVKFNVAVEVLKGGGTGLGETAKTWASVAANTTAEQTFTVTGVGTTDFVWVNKPTAQAGLGIVGGRVTAADTIGITFSNNTAAGITPTASESYTVLVIKSAAALQGVAEAWDITP